MKREPESGSTRKSKPVEEKSSIRYWLSFELPLVGKYEELYGWLDSMGAKECGHSVATFKTNKPEQKVIQEVTRAAGSRARLYLISKRGGGKFIQGRRKAPQWGGFGHHAPAEESLDI